MWWLGKTSLIPTTTIWDGLRQRMGRSLGQAMHLVTDKRLPAATMAKYAWRKRKGGYQRIPSIYLRKIR